MRPGFIDRRTVHIGSDHIKPIGIVALPRRRLPWGKPHTPQRLFLESASLDELGRFCSGSQWVRVVIRSSRCSVAGRAWTRRDLGI